MRVLLVGPWPPPFGGVQTHLASLRQRLRDRGMQAEVVNITSARATGDEGVHYPRTAWQLMRLLAGRECDVIHLHLGGHLSARLLALCAVVTCLPRRRAVLTFHSGGYPSSPAGKTATRRTARGLVMRRFDRIIVVNRELQALFLRLGCRADAVRLIAPHSLPLDAVPALRADARAALPPAMAAFFDRHEGVLLSVGLLEPEYDLELQIRAISRIREGNPGTGLIIIGGGSRHQDLARMIADSPDRDHILLAGDVAHADTLRAIRASDVLLRTTKYDGDSISVREALAMGTPVIATDTGLRPDGCILFRVGDLDGLAAAVRDVPPATEVLEQVEAGGENLDAVIALYEELAA